MTNEETVKVPKWFWGVSVLILIWNLMGLMNFFQHISLNEETLAAMPENQRVLVENTPIWVLVFFGLAVFGGVAGSISLLMKKKSATRFFIISIIASILQMVYSFNVAADYVEQRKMIAILALMITGIGIFSIWLSKMAAAKAWLK